MKVINSKLLKEIKRFKLYEDEVIHNNGIIRKYSYIDKQDASLIIPIFNNRIGMINIERYLISGSSLEFIGGRIENNEKPIDAAYREFMEETNLKPQNMKLINIIYPLPSITNEKVYIFETKLNNIKNLELEGEELIREILFFKKEELLKLILNNKIKSGIDAFALSYYLLKQLS